MNPQHDNASPDIPRHFVVIGGSHGIGYQIINRLITSGARVTTFSRTGEACTSLPNVAWYPFDVMQDSLPSDHLPETIDGFVYCPGSINLQPFRGLKPAMMLEDFQLNVIGAATTIQACLAGLKRAAQPSIVLFSTVAVSVGLPMHASVAAAKGAIEGLTRSLAAELAPKIRVNCLAPALTDTPLAQRLLSSDEKRAAMSARYPLKRVGNADDLAAMAEFLLTGPSTWMTGQVLHIDGGLSSVQVS